MKLVNEGCDHEALLGMSAAIVDGAKHVHCFTVTKIGMKE
jgi:hypothetical protein